MPSAAPVGPSVARANPLTAEEEATLNAEFDDFLTSSAAGTGGAGGYNAVVAVYAALGYSFTTAQAAARNANSTRDLLKVIDSRDQATALSGGWALNLPGTSFDALNVSKLKFLRFFKNMSRFAIVMGYDSVATSLKLTSLADVSWLGEATGLTSILLATNASGPPSATISWSGFSFLSGLRLNSLDVSSLYRGSGNGFPAVQGPFAGGALPWYLNQPQGMQVILPASYSVTADVNRYTVANTTARTTVTKIIAPALADPTPTVRSVYLDGTAYNAVVVDSKLIWPLTQANVSNFRFVDSVNNYYTTAGTGRYAVTPRTLTSDELAAFDAYNTKSVQSVLSNAQLTSPANAAAQLNATILVDDVPVSRILTNGLLVWGFDQRSVRFRNDNQTKFWRSYERIGAPDLASESLKVQSIAKSVTDALVDRSSGYVTDIAPPTEPDDTITVNATTVRAVLNVANGSYVWDFVRQGYKPEDIKFYSAQRKQVFTSVDAFVAGAEGQTNFFSTFSSARISSFDNIAVNVDPADAPHDLTTPEEIADYLANGSTDRLTVDGVPYGYLLRDGAFYADFPINEINYVYNDSGVLTYFTTSEEVPSNLRSSVELLASLPIRPVPARRPIAKPSLTTRPATDKLIVDDAAVIPYDLSLGVLYWRFTGSSYRGLSEIKYVDSRGNYYTDLAKLTPEQIVANQVGEVFATPDFTPSTTQPSSLLLRPGLAADNIDIVMGSESIRIDADGTVYSRRIVDSQVHWLDPSNNPAGVGRISIQEQDRTPDGSFREAPVFYTSLLQAASKSAVFPQAVRRITTPDPAFSSNLDYVEIRDPTSPDDTLELYNGSDASVIVTALASTNPEKPFVWQPTAIAAVRAIRFANRVTENGVDRYVYYSSITSADYGGNNPYPPLHVYDVKVDVSEEEVVAYIRNFDNVYENAAVKYALIAIFSTMAAAAAGFVLWRTIWFRR